MHIEIITLYTDEEVGVKGLFCIGVKKTLRLKKFLLWAARYDRIKTKHYVNNHFPSVKESG